MKKFALCFVTGLALVISGCADADNDMTNNETTNNEVENPEPSDVEEGEVRVGEQVTLTGDVSEVYDARSFSLSDEGWDWEQDLIVVTKDDLPFTAGEDAEVKVTGTVKAYSVVEVEKEYGWDFEPEVEAELEDTKYYLADARIEVIEPGDE